METMRHLMGIGFEVSLRVSERIVVPAVVGIWRPMILWPASWFTGLSQAQITAVLAHELAHIRRWDYLANVFQMLVEALLFFNPAVWWISRQVRNEREACCDAIAARVVGDEADVADALAGIAAGTLLGTLVPTAAVEFGRRHSGLVDRIRRLLEPRYRPAIRLPWHTLGLVLLSFALVIRLAGTGAELVVAAAAAALDGPKHVEQVHEIHKNFSNDDALQGGGEYPPDQRVRVSGTVRTHDGKPLPPGLDITIQSKRPSYSAGYSLRRGANGSWWSDQVAPGMITVAALARDYAPAVSKLIAAKPKDSIEGIELVLTEGFTMTAVVSDESGQPVAGASVNLSLAVNDMWAGSREVRTDADGRSLVPHLIEGQLTAKIELPGYERLRQTTAAKAGDVFPLVLRKSRPARGQIIDAITGEPVAGAEIRMVHTTDGDSIDPRAEYERKKQPYTTAGDGGQFTIDSLETGKRYTFWFEAEGYRPRSSPALRQVRST